MTKPPVYRAQSVSDLLNVVPTLFGFVPEESFIGICLSGDRRQFGFRLRIDLPESGHIESMANTVAGHLDRGEGQAVLLLGLSQDADRAADVVEAVARRITGKEINFAVWASDTYWWSSRGEQGTPWHRDPFHESIVKAVSHGQVILPSRASIEQEFIATDAVPSITVLERQQHAFNVARERESAINVTAGIATVRELIANLNRGETLSVNEAGLTGIWLRNLLVRDHFWFEIGRSNARDSLEIWTRVASQLSGVWRSAPLTLAAFSAWQAGDGVRTLLAAEAALKEDPEYSMARLMLQVVEQGLPPETWKQLRSGLGATG